MDPLLVVKNIRRPPKQIRVQYKEKHNGLVLKSRISSNIEVKMHVRLARCLMPSYWKFAKLSRADVQSILGYSHAKDVWLLALALGVISLSPSSFRTSYTSLNDIAIGSRQPAIKNILAKFELEFVHNQEVILDNGSLSLDHVPALPKFYLTKQEYDRLSTTILPELKFFSEPMEIHSIFHYRENTLWVAIHFEGECLYAVKLWPKSIFEKSGRQNAALKCSQLPLVKFIKDQKVDDYNNQQYPVAECSENNNDNKHNPQPEEQVYCVVLDDGALFAFH